MSMTQIIQRQSVYFSGSMMVLKYLIQQMAGSIDSIEGDRKMRAFDTIDITFENKVVIIEVKYLHVLFT